MEGVEWLFREILYIALKMRYGLNLVLIEGGSGVGFEGGRDEKLARERGVDYMIRGEVKEEGEGLEVFLRILNLRSGEEYKKIGICFKAGTIDISVRRLS